MLQGVECLFEINEVSQTSDNETGTFLFVLTGDMKETQLKSILTEKA